MTETFKKYKAAGLSCLPVRDDKSPASKTWKGGVEDGYENAFGIGIVCGKDSGNLECLDFDNHFGDAKSTLSSFMGIHEVIEIFRDKNLIVNSTQSGGYHVLYRCKTIGGNRKLAQKPVWDEAKNGYRPDTIIETRGEGGYFVAPPTPGYRNIRGDMSNIPLITEEEREILISASLSFNTWRNEEKKPDRVDGERLGDIYDGDQDSIYEAKQELLKAGWTDLGKGLWRRPGKDRGISATFGKVADNVFYCFTSSGYPFNEQSGYTPFRIVGLLRYNGDFSQFAKDLADRYSEHKEYEKTPTEKKEANISKMESILAKAFIDLKVPVTKPPTAVSIRDGDYGDWQRLFTLGNFSAITGKAKSRKTFLTSMIAACSASNKTIYDRIRGELPYGKNVVLRFDTEQSDYDAYVVSKRIADMKGGEGDTNFGTFDLREYTPNERCDIIEYALEKYKNSAGLVIIDGIADLANAINDEEEATRVATLLLRWTKVYNMHIVVVIHQNKGDGYATGHLGSFVMKKAEAIISVSKIESNTEISEVNCDMIRGTKDFKSFSFKVDEKGFPVILGRHGINTTYENIND